MVQFGGFIMIVINISPALPSTWSWNHCKLCWKTLCVPSSTIPASEPACVITLFYKFHFSLGGLTPVWLPHRVAWLQWMKPDWRIAWLQSPKILAFAEAIARKYVHLRAQAEGEKNGSLASCALCSAGLRPLCLFQRLLPSRDLTKQI